MKKGVKITLIIALALVVLGTAVLCTALAMGGNIKSMNINNETFTQKTSEINADTIESINITDINNGIEFTTSSDDKIHLTYYESEKNKYSISTENGTLSIILNDGKEWYEYINFGLNIFDDERTLSISVPKDKELSGIELKTTNGKLDIEDISANGKITIETTNGRINADNVSALDNLKFSSVNGEITASSLNGNNIDISTTNGQVRLEKSVCTSLLLHTTNGSLSFEDTTVTNSIEAETTNGRVQGTINGSMNEFSIKSHTNSGNNSLPEYTTGGKKTLNVETSHGSIDVQFRQ